MPDTAADEEKKEGEEGAEEKPEGAEEGAGDQSREPTQVGENQIT